MKAILCLLTLLFTYTSFAQTTITSKDHGVLEFVELDHGLAKVVDGKVEELKKTPTGTHGWLKDFVITDVTDSIHEVLKSNFGVVYIVKAKDTVDIDVDIEWIYPEKVTNEKGKTFKPKKVISHDFIELRHQKFYYNSKVL